MAGFVQVVQVFRLADFVAPGFDGECEVGEEMAEVPQLLVEASTEQEGMYPPQVLILLLLELKLPLDQLQTEELAQILLHLVPEPREYLLHVFSTKAGQ